MRKRLQNGVLLSMVLGLAGLICRMWLLSGGTDEKGLLEPFHPGGILCFVIAAASVAAFVLMFRDAAPKTKYRKLFPASKTAAAGTAVMAAGIGWSAMVGWMAQANQLRVLCGVLGIVACAALLLTAFCRFQGNRPNFLLSTAVAVFFILYMLSHYQHWSAEPELQRYVFQLAALISLTLRFYWQAALDLDKGGARALAVTDLCAIPLCCLAIPGSDDWLLYFSAVIFLSLSLSSMGLSKVKKAAANEGE